MRLRAAVPCPITESGFAAFNKIYVGTLERWKIFDGVTNPIARSNVCPAIDPPAEPSFHAFAYTEAIPDAAPSFVIAGSGEAPERRGNYRDHIVRLGDVTAAGLREKARFVLGEMERRMAELGVGWKDTTATQLYTVHDIHPCLADEIVRRGRRALGSPGTTIAPRWSIWSTRWTAAASHSSASHHESQELKTTRRVFCLKEMR